MKKDMRLVVLNSAKELGEKVNQHLVDLNYTGKKSDCKDYRVQLEETRFANGEGKIRLEDSVRDKDVYVLADVGNYNLSYNMRGRLHYVAPDEHFSDIKRVIGASANHARRVSLIMPLLYESRQDKRKGRESLDCALALRELENLGINNLISFDVHNPAVDNAIPTMAFENFYPTSTILENLIENETMEELSENLLVLAPDFGAMARARYYAEMLGCDVGAFYKRRDYSRIVGGKNPIVEHSYLGPDMDGENVIIVDDMIASGGSVLEVAMEAKKRGAKRAFICATFALFTEGIDKIEEAYNNNVFDYIYSTNLSYVPDEIKNKKWYVDVDCSEMIARIISTLNKGKSVEPIHNENLETYQRLRKIR